LTGSLLALAFGLGVRALTAQAEFVNVERFAAVE
jgi:hypothetical protein